MSLQFNIAKNTIIQLVGKTITLVLSIIVTTSLTRYLGPEGYGKYTFIFTYISFFVLLGDFGLNSILVREISKEKNNADILIGNALVIKTLFSTVAIFLSVIIICLLNYSNDIKVGVAIASITIAISAFETLRILFQIYLKMEYQAVIDIVSKIVFLGLVLGTIFYAKNLYFIIASFVLSSIISLILTIYFSFKFIKPKFKIHLQLWPNLLKEVLPLGISLILTIIYGRIDIIMLSLMKSNEDVGLYNLAYKFIELLTLLVPGTIMVSIFPIMSEQFKTNKNSLQGLIQKTFDIMIIVSVFIAIETILSAEKIILILGGENFKNSTSALQILIMGTVFIFIGNIFGFLLISAGMQRLNLITDFIGSVLNISLNLYLISKFSFIGASVSTVLTQAVVLVIAMIFVNKFINIKISFRILKKIIFISILIYAEILFLEFFEINTYTTIIISSLTYFLLVFLFKCFLLEELRQIMKEGLNRLGFKEFFDKQ